MENPNEPKQGCWRFICRYQLLGAAVGALLTFAVLTFCSQLRGGESSGGIFWAIPWFAVAFPTWGIYKLFGFEWNVGSFSEVPEKIFMSMVITNAILFSVIGTLGDWFLNKRRSAKNG